MRVGWGRVWSELGKLSISNKLVFLILMGFNWLHAKWIFWTSAQRITSSDSTTDGKDLNDMNGPVKGPAIKKASAGETSSFLPSSSLIFGYLNLFSDGVVSSIPRSFYALYKSQFL